MPVARYRKAALSAGERKEVIAVAVGIHIHGEAAVGTGKERPGAVLGLGGIIFAHLDGRGAGGAGFSVELFSGLIVEEEWKCFPANIMIDRLQLKTERKRDRIYDCPVRSIESGTG